MYTTLRSNPNDDGLQVNSEWAAHQASQRRACKHCHRKKLRCTREEGGCYRCSLSGKQCEYDTSPPKRKRIGTSTSRTTIDATLNRTPTPGYRRALDAELQHVAQPLPQNDILDVGARLSPVFSADSDWFNFLGVNLDGSIPDGPILPHSAMNGIQNSSSNTGSEVFAQSNCHPRRVCKCLASAVSLLEAISIQYVQANLKIVPQLIRHNKSALVQCRALLLCDTCSQKSDFVMLLILLCQKIVISYQHIVVILMDQFNTLHRPNGHDEVQISVPSMESAMGTAREVEMREYQVDVEEEPCVFGGVVQMQIKKMITFLGMLKGTLIANGWSSHAPTLDLVESDLKELVRLCRCPDVLW